MKKVIKYALIPLFELGLFGAATPSIVDIKEISINVNSHVSYLDHVEPFSDLCEEYYSFNKVTLTRRSFPNASFDALFINNVYQDTDIESDSYTIDAFSKDMDVDNYYTDTSLATVYVIDSSNRLLGYKSFVKDSLLDLDWLKTLQDKQFVPHGYVFDNFYYQNEVVNSSIVLDRSIVVQSRVKENGSAKKYNVLVNRDDGTKDFLNCEFDKTLTLESTSPSFSYWEVGDKIVSYKNSYTFSVYSNLVIKEVCKVNVVKQPIIHLYNDDVNVEGMDNIYEVRYELPDTCSFVEAGMIFDGEDIYSPNKVIAQNRTSNNEFSVRYDSTPDKVKAYLIYRDGSEVKVIYHEGFEVDHLVFFNSESGDSNNSYKVSTFSLNSIFKSGITVSSIDKVYRGSNSTLKFSSSSDNGFLNLATSNSVNKIRVNASNYKNDSARLTINQVPNELTTSFTSYDFEFDSTNTIEIRATNRCYISSIELFYSKETKVFTLDNLTLGDLSNVTTDLELPSTHEGYVVSWSSSDEDVVTSTGRVTRFLDDKEVVLTATCNGLTKEFKVTVKGNSKNAIIITDEEKTQYSSYYSSIDNSLSLGMNGTFCSRLTSLLYPKDFYTYYGNDVGQTGYELIALNEDPSNPDNMIMFYTQDSIKKEVSGDGTWNREHVWCQSLSYATKQGEKQLYGTTGGGVDILHLMPTYNDVKSTRNNRRYDEIPSAEERTYNGCYYGKICKEENFEPRDDVKGDAARICLYMWVVYLKAHGSKITNVATSLEMLVRWSNEDKPSQIEKNRNNLAQQGKQKNRNPFVDHPEWVNYIFGAEYNA